MKRILILWTIGYFSIKAQSISICHTPMPSGADPLTTQNLSNLSGGTHVIRIFLHIVRRDDGTGGLTTQEIATALDILKQDFEPHGICFSLAGIDEIHSSYYYNSFNTSKFYSLIQINNHPNAIDVYLLGRDTPWGGGSGGGMASGIPGDALCVVGNGNSFNAPGVTLATSRVLSHEMGHCLGLYHTHETSFCQECHSNCSVCGDKVCDTPPDPYLGFQVSQPPGCLWLFSSSDPCGAPYNPDTKNIMAYTLPTCMDHFTPGQGLRMHAMIAASSLLQQVVVPNDYFLQNLVVAPQQSYLYDALTTITAENIQVLPQGSLVLRAGQRIHVRPSATGLSSQAFQGSFFHAYIDNTCSTIDVVNNARITPLSDRNTAPKPLTMQVSTTSERLRVSYTLPQEGEVYGYLYDIQGKLLSAFNNHHRRGTYYHDFSVSSGIYVVVLYYRASSGRYFIETQKVAILE